MTDATATVGGGAGLPSAPSVPDAISGLEARPGLLTLVTAGGAPVCDGDSCLIDAGSFAGAEGDWTEVPD
ncbi:MULTISPECIES: hypothetical protein [Curtobacterium]|uniref:Uncharacterized protein n=1 Tax=Curtobacterium poinsettiae TaxID=159612 RepID=A0ABT3RYR0_9MICO|nr:MULTISPECIES: hypothetical protein [Curtobacterium]MBT1611967.1 hypothetical protein [Curtobacterium flaccumfaciens pv. poinsettiae]MBT1620173.1 hypothetical protein [Curtobacterium flaccumfaciens pv. poinsettiae]MCS6565115.1 hypothetical protein [Curtobacterium flaccumfaciens pv. flaccumfaciens]MCX2847736.1 hypothetical protein [Curtobacterium flaccumfaciens pv. poinsettiae]MDQ0538389.1 hypothetical protein [Curtobacterium flaccumfaciens]